jgi:hypothetical protein
LYLVVIACGQKIWQATPFLRDSRQKRRTGSGPYRDSLEARCEAGRERIRELEHELQDTQAKSREKDKLIEQFFRDVQLNPSLERTPRISMTRTRFALLMSLVASSCLVIGAIGAIPSPASSGTRFTSRPTMQPTQITWGGEVTFIETRAAWAWQCHSNRPTLLAIGSQVIRTNCHLPLPAYAVTEAERSIGERSWILHYYPERRGPTALTYVLN